MLAENSSVRGAIEEFMIFTKASSEKMAGAALAAAVTTEQKNSKEATENSNSTNPKSNHSKSIQQEMNHIKQTGNNLKNSLEQHTVILERTGDGLESRKGSVREGHNMPYHSSYRKMNTDSHNHNLKVNKSAVKNNSLDECDLVAFTSKLEKIKYENEKEGTDIYEDTDIGFRNQSENAKNNSTHHYTMHPDHDQELENSVVHVNLKDGNVNYKSQTLERRHPSSASSKRAAAFKRRTKSVEAVDGYRANKSLLGSTIHEEEPEKSGGLPNRDGSMSIHSMDRRWEINNQDIAPGINQKSRFASQSIPAMHNSSYEFSNNRTTEQNTWLNSRSSTSIDKHNKYSTFNHFHHNPEEAQLIHSRSHGNLPQHVDDYHLYQEYENTIDPSTRLNSRSFGSIAESKLTHPNFFRSLDEYNHYGHRSLDELQDDSGYETNSNFSKTIAGAGIPSTGYHYEQFSRSFDFSQASPRDVYQGQHHQQYMAPPYHYPPKIYPNVLPNNTYAMPHNHPRFRPPLPQPNYPPPPIPSNSLSANTNRQRYYYHQEYAIPQPSFHEQPPFRRNNTVQQTRSHYRGVTKNPNYFHDPAKMHAFSYVPPSSDRPERHNIHTFPRQAKKAPATFSSQPPTAHGSPRFSVRYPHPTHRSDTSHPYHQNTSQPPVCSIEATLYSSYPLPMYSNEHSFQEPASPTSLADQSYFDGSLSNQYPGTRDLYSHTHSVLPPHPTPPPPAPPPPVSILVRKDNSHPGGASSEVVQHPRNRWVGANVSNRQEELNSLRGNKLGRKVTLVL